MALSRSFELLLATYGQQGKPVRVDFRKLVQLPSYPERAAHLIHPYPAKLLAHIPFYFLAFEELSRKGDLVLDPFCGSGTVLLEAILAGRNAVGADANPLARLIATVKTYPYDTVALKQGLRYVTSTVPEHRATSLPDVVNIERWFYPHVIAKLACLLEGIRSLPLGPERAFFEVCFSACLRRVTLADPRLSVPVRQVPEHYPKGHPLRSAGRARLNGLKRVNVVSQFVEIVEQNIRRMVATAQKRTSGARVMALFEDARRLSLGLSASSIGSKQPDSSVNLVITSPPYAGAQKYIRASSLSLGWLGFSRISRLRELEDGNIGREHFLASAYENGVTTGIPAADHLLSRIRDSNPLRAHIAATYLLEMRDVLAEVKRVLVPGGHLVLVAGNNRVCGRAFPTADYLMTITEGLGLETRLVLVDHIRSRGLMTKRNHTAGLISQEWVYLFRKAS